MGEYITTVQDGQLKIGTCEDLYYVTYQSLIAYVDEGAKKAPGNLEPREYLKAEHGFRYRFPFPDESEQDRFHNPTRGWKFSLPVADAKDFIEQVDHDSVCHRVSDINVWHPCIWSKEWSEARGNFGHSPLPSLMALELVQQKFAGGILVPVLKCGCCGSKFRVESVERVEQITEAIRSQATDAGMGVKVAIRLLDPFASMAA